MRKMPGMQAENPPARLLIIDDHALVREGLRAMLASEPGVEVVGEAADGREALELCRASCPDLALMDVRMPIMDGLEATREIKRECPQTSILMVTTHESPDYLFEAVKAGAAGYILKNATKSQMSDAITRILGGDSVLNDGLVMQLLRRLAGEQASLTGPPPEPEKPDGRVPAKPLTARELETLRYLTYGHTNQEIARKLVVSTGTVKHHVRHIIAKLGVSDRTQAAVRAIELGLLSKP
jgi:DNA-binding NarL/FixJ family response regulator